MSDDEYDAYNLSLDVEDLPFITSLPPSPPTTGIPSQETRPSQEEETREGDIQDSQDSQSSDLDVFYTAPSTQIDAHHSDSYSDYDLSEFTADDFASFDAAVTDVGESSTGATKRVGAILNNAARAGPAVSVVLEGASKTLRDMGPPGEPPVRKNNSETNVSSYRQMKEASPYERFRSWRGALSVTDLTSPSWCEVQFDYGLRQKRFKKVEERPTEFQTAAGKTIIVDTSVAVVNDLVAERGRSVHKVLERELHPEEIKVETTTEEERLVNMIASMQSLQHAGRCVNFLL
ncbi:hypothetical protein EUX98_g5136 [Antrodiella citrinella]|uniref:Uncharacterized protein n=1 Tax=Antrodiella citrinella TaxID=2447956 RepID=A0A4V6S1U4_9APHY|nr:hypothetical protein EUX98_g5136 [Antrodiella citrinella]